jgi:hypothetical protein
MLAQNTAMLGQLPADLFDKAQWPPHPLVCNILLYFNFWQSYSSPAMSVLSRVIVGLSHMSRQCREEMSLQIHNFSQVMLLIFSVAALECTTMLIGQHYKCLCLACKSFS